MLDRRWAALPDDAVTGRVLEADEPDEAADAVGLRVDAVLVEVVAGAAGWLVLVPVVPEVAAGALAASAVKGSGIALVLPVEDELWLVVDVTSLAALPNRSRSMRIRPATSSPRVPLG